MSETLEKPIPINKHEVISITMNKKSWLNHRLINVNDRILTLVDTDKKIPVALRVERDGIKQALEIVNEIIKDFENVGELEL
jgi:hypothetical protein